MFDIICTAALYTLAFMGVVTAVVVIFCSCTDNNSYGETVSRACGSVEDSVDATHLRLIKTWITLDFTSKTGIATDGPAWYVLKVTSNEFKEAIGKDTLVHVLNGYGLFKRKVGNFKSLGAE